jgi:hypothetical protein
MYVWHTTVLVLQAVRTGDSATAAAAAATAAYTAAAAATVAVDSSSGGAKPSNSEAASSTLRNKVLLELTRRNWPMITVQPLTVTRRRAVLLAFLRRSHGLDTASATTAANDDAGNSSDSSRPGSATAAAATAEVIDTDLTFLTGLDQFADSASADEDNQFDEFQHGELENGGDVAGDSPNDAATAATTEGLLLFPAMVEAIVQCEACSCALYLQVT